MPSYAVMSNMVKEEMKRKVKKQLALLCKDESLELTELADTIEKLNYITKRKPSRYALDALCEGSEGEGGEEKPPKQRVKRLFNIFLERPKGFSEQLGLSGGGRKERIGGALAATMED